MLKRRNPAGPMSVFGLDVGEDRMGQGQSSKIGAGTEYANFVETRIEGLARAARRDALDSPPVRRRWALPELVALAGLVVAFVVSLLA
jgi:hypothetical protein